MFDLAKCDMCPRECGANRYNGVGACGCSHEISVAKVMLHSWEEPCISGKGGAGCIFFGGCPLGCVFCQNKAVSAHEAKRKVTPHELGEIMLSLQRDGASCIDLVSPTQYTNGIIEAVGKIRSELCVPIVWNTGGYERPETIDALRGTADVFLTDFKYASRESGERYASCPDYAEYAQRALQRMVAAVGKPILENGMIKRGVIVRVLVLPGERRDAAAVLELISSSVGSENVLLSLMRQYTPDFAPAGEKYKNLHRRLTSFEYEYVLSRAEELGFDGFSQDKASASASYTPDFGECRIDN